MPVCCRGLILHAVQKEGPADDVAVWRTAFPDFDDHDIELAQRSDDLLSVLLLGTTGASWTLRAPGAAPQPPTANRRMLASFWTATPQDLTAEAPPSRTSSPGATTAPAAPDRPGHLTPPFTPILWRTRP